MRAGCRCENVVFVCLFFLGFFLVLVTLQSGAPCVRGVYSSNKHCVAVYRPISTRSPAFFSEGISLSLYIVLILIDRWRHKVPEMAVKNFENSKNRRKSLCAPLRIDS